MGRERYKDILHTEPDILIPYTPYQSEVLGVIKTPGYQTYTLCYGLDPETATQLFKKSQYNHIAQMTRDIKKRNGDPGRFSDKNTFEKWAEKGRHPFVLLDESGDLSMMVWLGPSNSLPDEFVPDEDKGKPRWTYAIRRYEPHQYDSKTPREPNSPSLTAVTSEYVVHTLSSAFEEEKGQKPLIWLSTTRKNDAALALYNKTGWKEVGTKQLENGDEEVFMIH